MEETKKPTPLSEILGLKKQDEIIIFVTSKRFAEIQASIAKHINNTHKVQNGAEVMRLINDGAYYRMQHNGLNVHLINKDKSPFQLIKQL